MSTNVSEVADRTLYGFWLSPYMSLVAHVLTEAGLEYRYERVSPYLGETLSDTHAARNSLGKIPALQDTNGLIISESQAICRYLARTQPSARQIYPCDDPVACAEVDRMNDFITFSISGPFFSWFVTSAYWPKAWGAKTEVESDIFGKWSMIANKMNMGRLTSGAALSPFLLGDQPTLPDFHLFHVLQLGKTFADFFDMPTLNLTAGDPALENFYAAMCERPSTSIILAAQQSEREETRREIFEEFAKAYENLLSPGKAVLSALFGHEV